MVYIRDDNRKAFIDEEKINTLLEETKNPEKERVEDIIAKSLSKQRLELEEMAVLLNCEDESLVNRIFEGAKALKRNVYGNRIVLFCTY